MDKDKIAFILLCLAVILTGVNSIWHTTGTRHIPAGYTITETCTEYKTTPNARYFTAKEIGECADAVIIYERINGRNRPTTECMRIVDKFCERTDKGYVGNCRYYDNNLVTWEEKVCVRYEAHLIKEAT
jgi:hypothetical protein